MASQPPPSCTYRQGRVLKLQVVDNYLTSQKSASLLNAETGTVRENSGYHGYDAEILESELLGRLSTILEPSDLDLAYMLFEVCLHDRMANAQAHLLKQQYDTENAVSVIGMESDVNIQSKAVEDLSISTPPPSPMNPGIHPVVAARLHYVLSKLISLVPEDEATKLESLQAAIREHERVPVVTTEAPMEITSPQASATASKAGPTITAHIQHLFQPFTMSVLKVVIEGHSEPVVLKLIDRRFCSKIRSTNEVPPWTKERELTYHDFIHSGEAEKFINWLNNDDESSEKADGDSTIGHEEAFLQHKCYDLYTSELAVYHALLPLQGHCVPTLLATVLLQPFPDADPAIHEHTAIHGLLLSYIPGFTLNQLSHHVPRPQWQRVCDDAVRAVKACSDLGILNEDVRPRNCIVRCDVKAEGAGDVIYRPFIIDFGMARCRRKEESEKEWRSKKREIDEEGAMGTAMMPNLEEFGVGGYVYERSGRCHGREEEEEAPEGLRARFGHRGDPLFDELSPGFGPSDGEELDVWHEEMVLPERAESPAYPQAFLVDAHDDLDSDEEDLVYEEAMDDTDGGFNRAYRMSRAEALALGIRESEQGH